MVLGHRAGRLLRRCLHPLGAQRPHPRAGRDPLPPHDRGHPGQRGGRPGAGPPPGRGARPAGKRPRTSSSGRPQAPADNGSDARCPAPGTTAGTTPAVQLDPRFVFDTFVAASSNRLAHAAAQAVAETPGRSYNPLFIYGDSGLGKTHLLHAIGNYVAENFPRRKVLYVTTETFMNDFVDSLRTVDHPGLQAPLPRVRRPADRRRPVHGEQGGAPGGVLPHLQRPQGCLQADRPHLGPPAQVDRDPGGPPAQPLPLGPDHRDRPPRPRDPPGHPALQVRERAPRDPRRRARVHRRPREEQHPGARGGPDPGQRLRQAQQGGHLPGPGRAGALRHRLGRRAPAHHPPDDPRRHRRQLRLHASRPSAAPAGPAPWSRPARSPCTWCAT